jgi:aminoglycoside phosphotransferase (APT) family kinase protein
MKSKTKSNIDSKDIKKIFSHYFTGAEVINIEELKDGCFNISYLVVLDTGREYVLKIAPPDDVELLTYEKDLMITEINFHSLVEHHLRVPVPEIVKFDFTKNIIPYNYFIMNKLNGFPLDKCEPVTRDQRKSIYKQLAKYLAYMHTIKGEHFGYESLSEGFIGKNYYDSYKTMFKHIINDADKKSIKLPVNSEELFNTLDKYSYAFESIIEPVFVHYDLWDGNIFVSDMDTSPTIEGLIDFERGFFADPAADISQMAGYIDLQEDTYFLEEYNKYAKVPFNLGESELIRVKLFRLYVFSIMVVESYYRDVDGSYDGQLNWAKDEFLKLYSSIEI